MKLSRFLVAALCIFIFGYAVGFRLHAHLCDFRLELHKSDLDRVFVDYLEAQRGA